MKPRIGSSQQKAFKQCLYWGWVHSASLRRSRNPYYIQNVKPQGPKPVRDRLGRASIALRRAEADVQERICSWAGILQQPAAEKFAFGGSFPVDRMHLHLLRCCRHQHATMHSPRHALLQLPARASVFACTSRGKAHGCVALEQGTSEGFGTASLSRGSASTAAEAEVLTGRGRAPCDSPLNIRSLTAACSFQAVPHLPTL